MQLSHARLFPLLLLFALGLLTFWLERTARVEETHPSLHRHDPDYIVNNFKITGYGPGGLAESTLSARKMVHYPDDDSTDLDAPRVFNTKPGEAPMTLVADRGALSQDGEDTFLYDNVLVVRKEIPLQPEMRMQTDFLHVVRSRSLVLTDRNVAITEVGRSLTARGMEYDNAARLLLLHEKVRGRFEERKNRK
jgi:lipopolysaccharide export system protein LptC